MLVLSRKRAASVVIHGSVRVRVIEIKGDSVRLGIDAPLEIPVHRHEVFERLGGRRVAGPTSLATGSTAAPPANRACSAADQTAQPRAAAWGTRGRRKSCAIAPLLPPSRGLVGADRGGARLPAATA